MLVFFEITGDQFQTMPSDERTAFFDKIMEASRIGSHRFIVSLDLYKWAKSSIVLSDRVRSLLLSLYEANIYQTFKPNKLKNDYLVVQRGMTEPTLQKPHKWVIGHIEIVKGNYLAPSQLLVENSHTDGNFFDLVIKNQKKKNMKDFRYLDVKIIGGEDDGIGNRFVDSIRMKQIICCICDSDMLAPKYRKGATYYGIRNHIRYMKYLGHFDVTPCHEAENFLNTRIIAQLLSSYGDINKLPVVAHIENLMKKQGRPAKGNCIWLYVDIKSGLNGKNIKPYQLTGNISNWLCQKYCVNNISQIDIPFIGSNIMGNFLKNSPAKSSFHRHMRSRYWKEHFSDWIEQYMWYFVGQEVYEKL